MIKGLFKPVLMNISYKKTLLLFYKLPAPYQQLLNKYIQKIDYSHSTHISKVVY
jgi:hypothetical protein